MAKRKYKRDPRDIELALATYTVIGQQVVIPSPVSMEGEIESVNIPEDHPQGTQYRVKFKKPISFGAYAKKVGASTTRRTAEGLEDNFAWQTMLESPLRAEFPKVLKDAIERGSASQVDLLLYSLWATGCLTSSARKEAVGFDYPYNVACLWVNWNDARYSDIRRGMLVEFASRFGLGGQEVKTVSGRILGSDEKEGIIFLELFEPSPLMIHPQIIRPEHLTDDMLLDVAWFYGPGLYEALTEAFPEPELVPEGDWMEGTRIFKLKKPVPIKKLDAYCSEHFSGPDADACAWQAVTSYVLPIALNAGTWHPLRVFEAEYFQGIIGVELKEPWE